MSTIGWLLDSVSVAFGAALVLIIPFALPVWRETVAKFLGGLIQRRFDEQIERLRSDLRQSEERFKSELGAKEREIKALSETTLSLRSSRQSALDARRLVAVERLWQAKARLDTLKMAAKILQTTDFKAAARATATDPQAQKVFEMFDPTDAFTKHQAPNAEAERPFLTPVVWAAFSAYQSVLFQALLQVKFLVTGVGKPELLDPTKGDKLVKAALPHFSSFIDEYPDNGRFYLIEHLEEYLLKAVSDMLEGKEDDAATIQQASQILKIATEIGKSVAVSPIELPSGLKAESPKTTP